MFLFFLATTCSLGNYRTWTPRYNIISLYVQPPKHVDNLIQCEYQPSLCTHHLPSKWSPFSTRMQVKHYSFILVLYLNLINSFHFNFYFKSKFYTNLNVKIFLFKSNYFHLNDYLNRFTIFIHKFMIKCTSLQ